LYERLQKVPQLASVSSAISNFHLSAANNAIGQYAAQKQAILDLIGRGAFSRETMEQTIMMIDSLSEELRVLRQDSTSTDVLIRLKANQIYRKVQFFHSCVKDIKQRQEVSIVNLLTLNAALTTANLPQANERNVHRVLLQNELWEKSPIAPADVPILETIASQCPL